MASYTGGGMEWYGRGGEGRHASAGTGNKQVAVGWWMNGQGRGHTRLTGGPLDEHHEQQDREEGGGEGEGRRSAQ